MESNRLDILLVLLIFLPFFLPERLELLFTQQLGLYTVEMPQILLLVICFAFMIRGLLARRLSIPAGSAVILLVALVWAITTGVRIMLDIRLLPYACASGLTLGMAWLPIAFATSEHVFDFKTTSVTRIMHWLIILVVIGIVIQQALFGLYLQIARYGGESLGSYLRMRTTIGAATGTGHTLFLLLLVLESISIGKQRLLPKSGHLLFMLGIVLSASRSAIIMFALYELLRLFLTCRRLAQRLLMASLFIVVMILLLNAFGVYQRFSGRAEQSTQVRIEYLSEVTTYFTNLGTPLIGMGFGGVYGRYRVNSNQASSPPAGYRGDAPHNTYGVILNEVGIVGICSFIFLLLAPVVRVINVVRHGRVVNRFSNANRYYAVVGGYLLYVIIGFNTETLLINGGEMAIPVILTYYSLYGLTTQAEC
jgi:hypothetical protein